MLQRAIETTGSQADTENTPVVRVLKWATFLVVVFWGRSVECQEIRDQATCTECRIELEVRHTLGEGPDRTSVLERRPSFAARDSRGRIVVTQVPPEGLAYLFDVDGRFLRRIGRVGSGPGEFRDATTPQFDSYDMLHLFDLQTVRRTVLTPGMAYSRSTPMVSRTVSNLSIGGGRFVAAGAGPGAGPFHVSNASGRWERSFGGDAQNPSAQYEAANRRLGPADSGRFWAAPLYRAYELELWRADGVRERSFTRTAAWFPPDVPPSSGATGVRPTPTVAGLRQLANGDLMVLIHVARADWQRALGKAEIVPRVGTTYPHRSHHELYESIIEVIDVARARVRYRTRLATFIPFLLGDREVGVLDEDEDGAPRLRVGFLRLPAVAGGR